MSAVCLDDLYGRVADFWPQSANAADEARKKHVLSLVQDRLKTLKDLPVMTDYFFAAPTPDLELITGNKQLKKLSSEELVSLLTAAKTAFETADFAPESLQETLNQLLEITGQKPGVLFSLIRVVVSWAPFSPALNDTLAALGKEESLARIQTAIDHVSTL